jgi:AraC-like DNA-binding protein
MLSTSMSRPTKEPPSPSPLVPSLLGYVRARGADPGLLVLRCGLPADAEERDEVPVTAAALSDLLEGAAELLGEPSLGLRLPDALASRRYGHAELAARASATVREALTQVARYAALVLPQLECALDEAGGEAVFRARTRGHPRGTGRHAQEYAVAYALTMGRHAEDERRLVPARVWFAHARPPDLTALHLFFGTREIEFGREDSGFALLREDLDVKARGGDARLLLTAEELADAALRAQPRARELTPLVDARIEALLPENASMDAVAAALHMSARTLQRRLEEEGTRFSEVLDAARERLARRLLGDHALSLAEVGYRLGFADLATFSRAFKRWTGKPPGAWRRG